MGKKYAIYSRTYISRDPTFGWSLKNDEIVRKDDSIDELRAWSRKNLEVDYSCSDIFLTATDYFLVLLDADGHVEKVVEKLVESRCAGEEELRQRINILKKMVDTLCRIRSICSWKLVDGRMGDESICLTYNRKTKKDIESFTIRISKHQPSMYGACQNIRADAYIVWDVDDMQAQAITQSPYAKGITSQDGNALVNAIKSLLMTRE